MPVGDYEKPQIRKLAEEAYLPVAHKADSQDICFVPNGDYASFIEEYTGKIVPEGNFVTPDGKILGRHKGIIHYTVGQRKGLGISLGEGNFKHALFYFIPISAYVLGAIASEILPTPIKHYGLFRWDTWLVGFEALILFIIGFIPTTVPDPVVQVAVNFIASMQYNTFRQAEGIPMATTFCTNHIRQVGIGVAKLVRKHDQKGFHRGMEHLGMIVCFCVGAFLLSVFCKFMNEKSIWIALVPLLILFYRLAHADLTWEHDLLNKKPAGH